ncbi:MAG: photosystem II S4 domain protein [Cyanobium sp. M30B3]|nr:MAG: photosystem II S4 domain protein [Cyanobium sp. M30B3]
MLPQAELLQGSRDPAALEGVLAAAEQALRTWQPCWTGFLDGGAAEEAELRLGSLAELEIHGEGGYPGAERRRLVLGRRDTGLEASQLEPPLVGVEISGNFLFDPAEPADLRAALLGLGLPEGALGDLWLRGDRGGQGVVGLEWQEQLQGCAAQVRSVPVQLHLRPLAELQPPPRRQPRRLHSVEASTRLDAVASAGFGLARNRLADLVRAGQVRVNWQPVTSPSHLLRPGDRVQLSGKGELMVEAITTTKRDRFRIALLRR